MLCQARGIATPSVGIMLPAGADDTNPKRQRGSQLVTSLALRVSMECAIFGRGQYKPSLNVLNDGRQKIWDKKWGIGNLNVGVSKDDFSPFDFLPSAWLRPKAALGESVIRGWILVAVTKHPLIPLLLIVSGTYDKGIARRIRKPKWRQRSAGTPGSAFLATGPTVPPGDDTGLRWVNGEEFNDYAETADNTGYAD